MTHKFLLCINSEGYETSLELKKLYEQIPDKEAEKHQQVRIIDESKEDYLYPANFFVPVKIALEIKNKFLKKAA